MRAILFTIGRMNPRVVIWFGIVMSTVIYLVLAFQFSSAERRDFEQVVQQQLVTVLYGLALVSFIGAWFVVPRVVKSNPQTRMICALAVFESCAIFGLIGAFMTQDWRVYIAPWVLALIGFMRELPRAAAGEPPAPV